MSLDYITQHIAYNGMQKNAQYVEVGVLDPQKETVMLVHGWGNDAFWWESISTYLVDHGYNVVLVELPGHGDQPLLHKKPKDWRMEDLTALVDHIGNELASKYGQVHYGGHSCGAMIGGHLAVQNPAWMKTAILISPEFEKNALKYLIKNNPRMFFTAAEKNGNANSGNYAQKLFGAVVGEMNKWGIYRLISDPVLEVLTHVPLTIEKLMDAAVHWGGYDHSGNLITHDNYASVSARIGVRNRSPFENFMYLGMASKEGILGNFMAMRRMPEIQLSKSTLPIGIIYSLDDSITDPHMNGQTEKRPMVGFAEGDHDAILKHPYVLKRMILNLGSINSKQPAVGNIE